MILFLTIYISFPYGGKPSLKRKANAFYSNTTGNFYFLNETEYTHEEPSSAFDPCQIQRKSPCTFTTPIKNRWLHMRYSWNDLEQQSALHKN